MKPVQLRIAGLHSYLDEQTIDFTQLCGAGVFGIFGPTGAGKSTVLDAMTLALYGKVKRAPRGTGATERSAGIGRGRKHGLYVVRPGLGERHADDARGGQVGEHLI